MAKNVTPTGATAKKFIKPAYIVATLHAETQNESEVPNGDVYILEDVIEDTTSVSQDDNDVNDIECETSDSPIISIVKMGKFQLAAEVADTQEDLIVAMMGYKASADGKKVFAPAQYKKKYARFDIVFEDAEGNMTAFVLPRVQLNSKLMLESLNSNVGRIGIAGTAMITDVVDGSDKVKTPFYIESEYKLPVEQA